MQNWSEKHWQFYSAGCSIFYISFLSFHLFCGINICIYQHFFKTTSLKRNRNAYICDFIFYWIYWKVNNVEYVHICLHTVHCEKKCVKPVWKYTSTNVRLADLFTFSARMLSYDVWSGKRLLTFYHKSEKNYMKWYVTT